MRVLIVFTLAITALGACKARQSSGELKTLEPGYTPSVNRDDLAQTATALRSWILQVSPGTAGSWFDYLVMDELVTGNLNDAELTLVRQRVERINNDRRLQVVAERREFQNLRMVLATYELPQPPAQVVDQVENEPTPDPMDVQPEPEPDPVADPAPATHDENGVLYWSETEPRGLWEEERPVVTRIVWNEGDSLIAESWGSIPNAYAGSEYWLTPKGAMTYSENSDYKRYRGSCEDAGTCGIKPHEVARRCMRQAYLTLKAIMENPPEEWTNHPGPPSLFGWINEAVAVPGNVGRYEGAWRWNNYLKWRGTVTTDGICTTPSLGEFKAFLRTFRRQ